MNYTKPFLFGLLILLFACKKNNGSPEENQELNPTDSKLLFQNIKVNHGEKLEGSMPTSSQNGPKLDEEGSNKAVPSISGKYAIIRPKILSGEIAGYYLRIEGFNEAYYKIDFSKPISGRRKNKITRRNVLSERLMDDSPDYTDSVIIIILPENVKPGTFCIEYLAYDWENNISNIIKQCITVFAFGGEEKLIGKWSLEKSRDYFTDWEYYPTMDTSYLGYYVCENNNLVRVYDPAEGMLSVPELIYEFESAYWQFSADGSGELLSNEMRHRLDLNASTCDDIKFTVEREDVAPESIVWSYDHTRKKLILMTFDENMGIDDFHEVDLEFIDQNRILIYYMGEFDDDDVEDQEWNEFVRIP